MLPKFDSWLHHILAASVWGNHILSASQFYHQKNGYHNAQRPPCKGRMKDKEITNILTLCWAHSKCSHNCEHLEVHDVLRHVSSPKRAHMIPLCPSPLAFSIHSLYSFHLGGWGTHVSSLIRPLALDILWSLSTHLTPQNNLCHCALLGLYKHIWYSEWHIVTSQQMLVKWMNKWSGQSDKWNYEDTRKFVTKTKYLVYILEGNFWSNRK